MSHNDGHMHHGSKRVDVDEVWRRLKQKSSVKTKPTSTTAITPAARIHHHQAAAPQKPQLLTSMMSQNGCDEKYLLESVRALLDSDDASTLQALCTTLVGATPPLPTTSKSLVALIAPLMSHTKRRVRAAAVNTVSALLLAGAHEMLLPLTGFRDPHLLPLRCCGYQPQCKKHTLPPLHSAVYGEGDVVVNRCARLVQDPALEVCFFKVGVVCHKQRIDTTEMAHATQVRVRFLYALQAWLTELPHRAEYRSRLLPYVVALLPDDQSTSTGRVGELAWQVLCAAGEQYAKDEAAVLQVTLPTVLCCRQHYRRVSSNLDRRRGCICLTRRMACAWYRCRPNRPQRCMMAITHPCLAGLMRPHACCYSRALAPWLRRLRLICGAGWWSRGRGQRRCCLTGSRWWRAKLRFMCIHCYQPCARCGVELSSTSPVHTMLVPLGGA